MLLAQPAIRNHRYEQARDEELNHVTYINPLKDKQRYIELTYHYYNLTATSMYTTVVKLKFAEILS